MSGAVPLLSAQLDYSACYDAIQGSGRDYQAYRHRDHDAIKIAAEMLCADR